jgi:hypothetical protein
MPLCFVFKVAIVITRAIYQVHGSPDGQNAKDSADHSDSKR